MIVLDTNVVSELMRPAPAAPVAAWIDRHPLAQLAVTAISEAEIFYGVELLPAGRRRDRLRASAEAWFAEAFRGFTLPFDGEAARIFSRIAVERRLAGKPIGQFDAQIASIVRVHRATLATRNGRDFEGCGIRVVNPWEEQVR